MWAFAGCGVCQWLVSRNVGTQALHLYRHVLDQAHRHALHAQPHHCGDVTSIVSLSTSPPWSPQHFDGEPSGELCPESWLRQCLAELTSSSVMSGLSTSFRQLNGKILRGGRWNSRSSSERAHVLSQAADPRNIVAIPDDGEN
jgi:hypothetical protein